MPPLTPLQEQLADASPFDFSDLRALFINCTIKRSPDVSNTDALADIVQAKVVVDGRNCLDVRRWTDAGWRLHALGRRVAEPARRR